MKKLIPYISPALWGLFGGVLVESALAAMSITVSPFSTGFVFDWVFFCSSAVISAAIIIVTALMYYAHRSNTNIQSKRSIVLVQWICEILCFSYPGAFAIGRSAHSII